MNEESGEVREDVLLPDVNSPNPEMGSKIKEAFDAEKDVYVVVTKAMDTEAITLFSVKSA